MDEMRLAYNEETGMFEEIPDPYIVIEIAKKKIMKRFAK